MRIIKKINEDWASDFAEAGRLNAFAFGFKERTYADNVFSAWKNIIAEENGNPEIIKIIENYEKDKHRYEFCAEYLYSKFKDFENQIKLVL